MIRYWFAAILMVVGTSGHAEVETPAFKNVLVLRGQCEQLGKAVFVRNTDPSRAYRVTVKYWASAKPDQPLHKEVPVPAGGESNPIGCAGAIGSDTQFAIVGERPV